MGDEAIYLYCFARPGAAQSLTASGVGGCGEVFEACLDGAAAVLGRVPLDDFSGEAAEGHLQDPDWVIPRACAHERVVEEVMARSPVLPARFGAVFSSVEKAEELLYRKHREISGFLADVADKEEWAVKGFLNADAASERLMASDPLLAEQRQRLAASPGARYLQEKKLRAAARAQARGWCRVAAERIGSQLREEAAAARPLRVRASEASGTAEGMVFHCAFLLCRGRMRHFLALVERLSRDHAEHGLALAASGPWPPYNFCPDIGGASA